MAAIFARQNFFENWDSYSVQIPCGSKISSKSLYLPRFSRYKHFCVLRNKFFLKIGMVTLQGYPACQKFRQKTLYLAQFSRYKLFCEKFENSKWLPFLARQKFFENWDSYSTEIPFGSNSKIQNNRPFWRDKYFLKIMIATLQRYPAAQKFHRNPSI